MLGLKIINKKEFMTYDDYVFDYTSGRWISASEYEKMEQTLDKMIEDMNWDDQMAKVEHDNQQSAMWDDFSFGL
jgi:CRISPR/Cas system CSM-associated protein Csm2 small subunit